MTCHIMQAQKGRASKKRKKEVAQALGIEEKEEVAQALGLETMVEKPKRKVKAKKQDQNEHGKKNVNKGVVSNPVFKSSKRNRVYSKAYSTRRKELLKAKYSDDEAKASLISCLTSEHNSWPTKTHRDRPFSFWNNNRLVCYAEARAILLSWLTSEHNCWPTKTFRDPPLSLRNNFLVVCSDKDKAILLSPLTSEPNSRATKTIRYPPLNLRNNSLVCYALLTCWFVGIIVFMHVARFRKL